MVADGAVNIGRKEVLDRLFFGDGRGALLLAKHDSNKGNDNSAITRVGHNHGTCCAEQLVNAACRSRWQHDSQMLVESQIGEQKVVTMCSVRGPTER